ncbi:MAG: hypothetical protein HOV71_02380 [Hamadaea sp.]|nr:hypothetical protein [Hamadaea sp.]NUR46960.1 hypothetical protein [Hamadaea sp.]NUT05628.1 hypothetical protein [Hamadaea sp.]
MDDYRPGRVATEGLSGRIDQFVRGPEDQLVHWWAIDFGASGVENLGGQLRGDPVTVGRAGRFDVFARGYDSRLLHWWWDGDHVAGPETRQGWRVAYDPMAVQVSDTEAHVYAQEANNGIRRFRTVGSDWSVDSLPFTAYGPPLGLPFRGQVALFTRDEHGELAATGEFHSGEGYKTDRLGGGVAGRPAAQLWNPNRIDVMTIDDNGDINHWGWKGTEKYWDNPEHDSPLHTGRWYGDGPVITGPFRGDLVLAGDGVQMDVYAVTRDFRLQNWHWDGTKGFSPWNVWELKADLGPVISSPSATLSADGRLGVLYAWAEGGVLHHWDSFGNHIADVPDWPSEGGLTEPVVIDLVPASHLLRRADDLVVLGVDVKPGRVGLTFPPQHIGESVNDRDTLQADVSEGGVPVWRSGPAGPSRLVFDVDHDVPLTARDLLAAATALVTDDPADQSAIELPYRLGSHLSGSASAAHHTEPWTRSDVVALWRTRLLGELGLVATGYGEEDWIAVPLGQTVRGQIVGQNEPATVERLELSALGGTLVAQGRWPAFEWDHTAVLGRDWRVRTLQRGIVYPTGHRAEYVELSQREPDPDGQDPIAVIRKSRILIITEPMRTQSADPRLARLFPFHSVETLVPRFEHIDDPDGVETAPLGRWTTTIRERRPPEQLQEQLQNLWELVASLPPMPGTGDMSAPPSAEDYADLSGGGQLEAEQAAWAQGFLALIEQIDVLSDQIEAVTLTQSVPKPWYFVPHVDGQPIRLPVRCHGRLGPVQIAVPVVFVADEQLPETFTMTAYDSLGVAGVDEKLAEAYAAAGGGPTDLPGVPVDLLHSTATANGVPANSSSIDIQLTRRLNITGVRDGRAYRVRLGTDDPADWAAEVDLVEARTLLPNTPAAHTAKLAYASEFETSGDAAAIPLRIAGAPITLDFRSAADRSGGLTTPVIDATGLSREHGLGNAAGLATLNPADLVTADATLLGINLRSLLGDVAPKAPAITSDLSPDGVTTVTLDWSDLPLTPGDLLQANGSPTLDLHVESGVVTTSTCTVKAFALALPPGDPLLKLAFDQVAFTQEAGRPPDVKIDGLKAEFLGALDLLKGLQDKIGIGDSLPEVRPVGNAIQARYCLPVPDVSTGAFVIRNASFSIVLTVPLQGEPPSVQLGFASREKPFSLSVLMFGGGGYADIEFRGGTLSRLEIALEFGAAVAVDFFIAKGEAHVLGGIRYEMIGTDVRLTGFLRIGGSLEVLGLVSVSVELLLELGYQSAGNRLVGRATLVLELDLTLWSDTVELDSGEWVISGDENVVPHRMAAPTVRPGASARDLEATRAYREAYR